MTFYYLTTDKPFDVTRQQLIEALDAGYYGWVGISPFGPGHNKRDSLEIEPVEQEDDDGKPDGYDFIVDGEYADEGAEAIEAAEKHFRDEAEDERRWEAQEQREAGKRLLRERLGMDVE